MLRRSTAITFRPALSASACMIITPVAVLVAATPVVGHGTGHARKLRTDIDEGADLQFKNLVALRLAMDSATARQVLARLTSSRTRSGPAAHYRRGNDGEQGTCSHTRPAYRSAGTRIYLGSHHVMEK